MNYGVPADYKRLEKLGVDVRGKIVIARYGASWRGIKPKVAAEKGAIGCLIYSDPRDDGYFEGDVYPRGSFRSSGGVQRGSVKDMAVHPGDALTPGVGATKDARRLDRKDVKTLTKIPVLPISYGDAQPLLAALEGPVAPAEWRGALPITYHVGPGPARVRLKVAFDWNIVPLHNVIARIPGSRYPDEWVMHGNHHDAWVNGAEDPVSGLVALLEEARALGTLRRGGWKPRRTIILAAWDGEEQGLLGSTEWVELHADELRRKAVAYINTDSQRAGIPVRGRLPLPGDPRQRGGRRDPGPGEEDLACGSACASRRSPTRRATRTAGGSATVATSPSTRSAPARTSPLSCSTSASPRSTWASAARTTAASTTPSTTTCPGTRGSRIRTTRTAARSPS